MPKLTVSEFIKLAKTHRVIPVVREIFYSGESPLTIFEKLAANNLGSFLLESAEQGVYSRYSFVGITARGTLLQELGADVTWISELGLSALPRDLGSELPINALDALDLIQKSWYTSYADLELPLSSGLVGMIGWDIIRDLESLPPAKSNDIQTPRIHFSVMRDLIVVDHHTSMLYFISNVFIDGQSSSELEEEYESAISRIENLVSKLAQPTYPFLAEISTDIEPAATANFSEPEFLSVVEEAKDFVRKGDVFQVVISQAFQIETKSTALDIYRILRALNPSPYMYLLNCSDSNGAFQIVGSSPESLVTVQAGRVTTHPIAGSRPRGKSTDEDNRLGELLKHDHKETAEHLMLVDLARNDLLRVCEPESVAVTEFMEIHRFSHIMHLVSTVEGKLREGLSAIDVFRSTFPAGTLSGAPKPRALEIIEDLEPTSRGLYGGVCGYFDFAGNSDLAIAIRTALLRDGIATVQAGAGLVLDSDPKLEFEETKSKARAVLRAIAASNLAKKV